MDNLQLVCLRSQSADIAEASSEPFMSSSSSRRRGKFGRRASKLGSGELCRVDFSRHVILRQNRRAWNQADPLQHNLHLRLNGRMVQ